MIASVLWTAATLLRVDRTWVPSIGWREALHRPLFWIVLILPPACFAAIIGAVRRMTNGGQ